MRAVVVTVAFNSERALWHYWVDVKERCFPWVLVDNASSDDSVGLAARLGAEVLKSPRNIGFGRACNMGAEHVLLGCDATDWLIFVNPDVRLDYEALTNALTDLPQDCVALSPLLVDATGTAHRDLARTSPTPLDVLRLYLFGAAAVRRDARAYDALLDASGDRVDVAVTSGACLAVRAPIFESIGGFPPWLFLNYEDVWLCDQLRKHGRIVVDRRVRMLHGKLSSSTGVDDVARAAETARAVTAYIASKYSATAWAVVCLCVTAGYCARSMRRRSGLRRAAPLLLTMLHEGRLVRRGAPLIAEANFL